MSSTLDALNAYAPAQFVDALRGIYEHSPWIPESVVDQRPFATLAALKFALQASVKHASVEQQLALIRAHPELAGKAAIAGKLTAESTGEQASAGLHLCSADEYATLQKLNADYKAKFGFPFILAVKGPSGQGLSRAAIIAALARRLNERRDGEIAECLRQIGRIAELRLNDLLGHVPRMGLQVMEWCETLSAWSDDETGLTCAYLTDSHQKVASQIATWMREAGLAVAIDAVGNVVGRLRSDHPGAKTVITGSHYDTVRNGGKYDGRMGVLLPVAIVQHLREHDVSLPFHFEIIGFADEEGVRFKSTFLGSTALSGRFDMTQLERTDSDGVSMRAAMRAAGHAESGIAAIARKATDLLAYVEVHIEQGPVLLEHDLPVGIVTSIAGSCRYLLDLRGMASHAGTTPMHMRRDAAAAAAEIVLLVEARCAGIASLVGTVGQLQVPNGSVNVIPGRCTLSLDIRAADDATRDAAVADILHGAEEICARRGIAMSKELLVRAAATPCAPWLMAQLAAATLRAGVTPFELPSGAGHDAMAMANITDVAMLFTRCGNGGVSHHPLEVMTADDAEVAAHILLEFLRSFSPRD